MSLSLDAPVEVSLIYTHIWTFPFPLGTTTILAHHLVGWRTRVITPSFSIRLSSSFTDFISGMATWRGIGRAYCSFLQLMEYSPSRVADIAQWGFHYRRLFVLASRRSAPRLLVDRVDACGDYPLHRGLYDLASIAENWPFTESLLLLGPCKVFVDAVRGGYPISW